MSAVMRTLSWIWPPVLIVVAWEVLVTTGGYNAIIIPRPITVIADIVGNPDVYVLDTVVTLRVAVIGLAIGLAAGLIAAILAWWSRILAGMLTPIAVALFAVPSLAFIPVLAQVLGYSEATVIAIAAIISFFPGFVFVSSGLRQLPDGAESLFASLGAGRRVRLLHLALPSTVPNLLLALRMSASTAVVAAVVAEYLMGTDGLGQAFVYHYKRFEMDRAFGIAIVIMLLSFAVFVITSWIERMGRARWT